MATIRKITPSQGISDFRQMRQEGGGGFRALAQAMDVATDMLMPHALAEAERIGTPLGDAIYASQSGGEAVVQSTMGPVDPNAQLGADAMAALGKGNDRYRNAIASIESAGSGDYSAIGPTNAKLGRALGRYQIMEANIGPWSREALGRAVSADEFLANPKIQDAIFDHKFGGYVQKFGEEGAAQAWFAGEGGVGKLDRSDVLGTTVGGYGQKFVAALGGGGGGVTASSSGPVEAPTVMRGADGKLTSRLFGPTSNPIMAAHDAAAGVAYQSDVFLKAGQDFMGMSEQFAMNPEGFKQASDEYVKAMVESAPEPFRMDIRSKLENEASRRFLGLVDEKHSNIRQRAANSSAALSEMWADDLASAIASGNPEEIAAAQTELSSILSARERLPGSTWTPEQSANYMRKAEEAGQASIKKAQEEQNSVFKDQLKTVADAATKMLTAADEAVLDNPLVKQLFPDEWRKAASAVIMRETMGDLKGMTPDQVSEVVKDFSSQEIVDPYQVDMVVSLQEFEKEHKQAFRSDPIQAAMDYFPEDRKPKPLPEFDVENPQAYLTALQERAVFGASLKEGGYTNLANVLTVEEAKAAKDMLGVGTPAAIRAAVAGAVVGALGPQATTYFKQAGQDDPILTHGGALMAHGRTSEANEAFVGAELLATKEAQKPTSAATIAEISPGIAAALDGFPSVASDAFQTAIAIAAARNPMTTDPKSEEAVAAMEKAIQSALGQTKDPGTGKTVGGVQDIGPEGWIWSETRKVLLPPDVAGDDVNAALELAFTGDTSGSIISYGSQYLPVAPEAWIAAGASSAPHLSGQPVRGTLWSDGYVRIKPLGNSGRYRMTYEMPNGIEDDVTTANGLPFTFDLKLLIEATQ